MFKTIELQGFKVRFDFPSTSLVFVGYCLNMTRRNDASWVCCMVSWSSVFVLGNMTIHIYILYIYIIKMYIYIYIYNSIDIWDHSDMTYRPYLGIIHFKISIFSSSIIHPCGADHFAGAMWFHHKKHLEALNKDLLSQSKKYATWQRDSQLGLRSIFVEVRIRRIYRETGKP